MRRLHLLQHLRVAKLLGQLLQLLPLCLQCFALPGALYQTLLASDHVLHSLNGLGTTARQCAHETHNLCIVESDQLSTLFASSSHHRP